MAELNEGDWFLADDGRVAHRIRGFVDYRYGRYVAWTWCAATRLSDRPATPEDRRCKRCEERSRG